LGSLLLFQHPRFIWYAMLSINGAVALELPIDATDMARSYPVYRAIRRDADLYTAFDTVLNAPAHQAAIADILTLRFVSFLKQADAP
jgi:hypothetical protein